MSSGHKRTGSLNLPSIFGGNKPPESAPLTPQSSTKGHKKKLSLSLAKEAFHLSISRANPFSNASTPTPDRKTRDVDHELIQILQIQLFSGEELKYAAKVKKASTKKKKEQANDEYLCVTVKREEKVRVQRVKGQNGAFLIKKTWRLEDLIRMEFFEDGSDTGFVLFFQDKPNYWSAANTLLRNEFLWTLWKMCQQYLPAHPQTSIDIFELRSDAGDFKSATSESSYKELMSPTEEKELETLLKSVPDIDELQEKLTAQLSSLEVENIHNIIEVDDASRDLLDHIDEAFVQLEAADQWLQFYLSELHNVKQYIENIEEQNNRMEIVMTNQKRLFDEVIKLLRDLTLGEASVKSLMSGNLDPGATLTRAIDAATQLEKIFDTWKQLSPEMQAIQSVKEKMSDYVKLRDFFSTKTTQYIQDICTKLANQYLDARSKNTAKDDSRSQIFKNLLQYTLLIQWLKRMDKNNYDNIAQAYLSCFKQVYKRELKDHFSETKHCIIKESQEVQFKDSGRLTEFIRNRTKNTPETKPNAKPPEKMTIDRAFSYSLEVMLRALMMEQNFCTGFFQFPEKSEQPDQPTEVDRMLKGLTDGLSDELTLLIEQGDKTDHFYPLSMLATVEQFKIKYEAKSSFIAALLQDLQNKLAQSFNKFIDEQMEMIRGTQVSIKKGGVLPFFANFPAIVDYIETKVKGSKLARTIVDEVYHNLVVNLFEWLNSLGDTEDEKYKFVIRFENFHRFVAEIGKRHVAALDEFVAQAQKLYDENVRAYVELLVRARFKTLLPFFDEMDKLLQTLPVAAIQFQQSHSKQSFLKVMDKNTAQDMEKRFKKIFKAIEDNVSKEEGLLLAVWEALVKYFIQQYTHFEDLVSQCYSNAELSVPKKKILQIANQVGKSKD